MKINQLINSLRLAKLNRVEYVKKKLNKKELVIIKLFLHLNILLYVKKLENNLYLIKVNTNNNLLKTMKNFSKPSHPKFIKFKTLMKITTQKNWILVLSTNQGIITNLNLNNNKVKIGGLLLFGIVN